MKQHFTDERTGISYTLQGDYYLPDLALPAEEQVESAFGDNGTCGISRRTAKVFIRPCSQNAN